MSIKAHVANHYVRTGLPPALPEFTHVNRYFDPKQKVFAAKIMPGEFYVSLHGEMIVTVLGSCVAACIRDVKLGIGGMNHFMLPVERMQGVSLNTNSKTKSDVFTDSARYGNWAMEFLINTILKQGGKKENLEVKLFGGGNVLDAIRTVDVGRDNIEFVQGYLKAENLALAASDLGDDCPRKVLYFADTGSVKIKRMHRTHNDTVQEREAQYVKGLEKGSAGDIDIF
ncbi:MAG: chemotaxis protein CheD [Gammaproteobacteria bacterium]|nr:MAG: chemotaxis protein CheD [Gammaproteobacteria bacterium]